MYILYTDDSILAGPSSKREIELIIEQIKATGLNIAQEGDIEDFLRLNIMKWDDGRIKLKQPYLIDQILKDHKVDNEKFKNKGDTNQSVTNLE